jgi:hypothetical protein
MAEHPNFQNPSIQLELAGPQSAFPPIPLTSTSPSLTQSHSDAREFSEDGCYVGPYFRPS